MTLRFLMILCLLLTVAGAQETRSTSPASRPAADAKDDKSAKSASLTEPESRRAPVDPLDLRVGQVIRISEETQAISDAAFMLFEQDPVKNAELEKKTDKLR